MSNYHFLFRLIVVGDSGVGKSCFVQQFLDGTVRQSHDVTVGVEFGSKTIRIANKDIKLQVWDTAGQQNFRSITRSYYRGAIGAFLMYDISRRITFDHIQSWVEQVKANGNPHINFFLIGNKNDLTQSRMVTIQQGKTLASKYEMLFMQTNYKDSFKIQQCFQQLSACIMLKIESQKIPLNQQNFGVKAGEKMNRMSIRKIHKNKSKQGCC